MEEYNELLRMYKKNVTPYMQRAQPHKAVDSRSFHSNSVISKYQPYSPREASANS